MFTKWWQEMCSIAKHTFYSANVPKCHDIRTLEIKTFRKRDKWIILIVIIRSEDIQMCSIFVWFIWALLEVVQYQDNPWWEGKPSYPPGCKNHKISTSAITLNARYHSEQEQILHLIRADRPRSDALIEETVERCLHLTVWKQRCSFF